MTCTAYDGQTARLALATSKDLESWKKQGRVFPGRGWTKSGAIADRARGGRYWEYFGDTSIWAARAEGLLNWTVIEKPVLRSCENMFDERLVEPGPLPVWAVAGFVRMYNGVDSTRSYAAGQALLDPEDLTHVLDRPKTPLLPPTTMLEKEGQVANVGFVQFFLLEC